MKIGEIYEVKQPDAAHIHGRRFKVSAKTDAGTMATQFSQETGPVWDCIDVESGELRRFAEDHVGPLLAKVK